MATITGTNASDAELEGTNLADQIFGLGGNDILIGFDGDDELEGGKGADQLFGSLGFDTATYSNSAAGVVVFLDVSYAVGGEASGDTLFSIEGLRGSSFADSLAGNEQRNVLHGEGGNDEIEGRDGNDMLDGGAGHDALGGGHGDDELRGGTGNDLLEAGPGNDTLRGGSGNDTVLVEANTTDATPGAELRIVLENRWCCTSPGPPSWSTSKRAPRSAPSGNQASR